MVIMIYSAEKLLFREGTSVHEAEVIHLEDWNKPFVDGRAYIIGHYVYVCRGPLSEAPSIKQIGLYTDGDKYELIHPRNDREKEKYSSSSIKEINLNIESMMKEIITDMSNFIDNDDVEILNSNKEVSEFQVHENDDFLKKVIKQAITSKEINLKNYATKLPNKHDLGNMISILTKDTKMSVVNFKRFTEMLGLRWELTLEDDGTDRLAPLKEKIEIDSENQ